MTTTSTGVLTDTKAGGAALLLGVGLVLVASLLVPGGAVIEQVDQTDFPRAISVMADYSSLSHLMTMVAIIAMLLHCYSFMPLLRLPRQPGHAGRDRSESVWLGHFHCGHGHAAPRHPSDATRHECRYA